MVGGKKLPNGDLGAFITSVDKNRAQQETLGELHEGDQVENLYENLNRRNFTIIIEILGARMEWHFVEWQNIRRS